jgi:Domain of unknown function (DUF4158)
MSTHIKILSKKEIEQFDNSPDFTVEERNKYFINSEWEQFIIKSLRNSISKLIFMIQAGYFRATGRFFTTSKFKESDVRYLVNILGIKKKSIDLDKFNGRTFKRHQEIIREKYGYNKYNHEVIAEGINLCSKQIKPRLIFLSLIEFLRQNRIELPNYYSLSKLITEVFQNYEIQLVKKLNLTISLSNKELLDNLMLEDDKTRYQTGKFKMYKLTNLKKSYQSTKVSKVKENIKDLLLFKELFAKLLPNINKLRISYELVQYYAQFVIKSQVFQISRRGDKRYLFLISFVIHQFYKLNDTLTETLLQSVKTTHNTSLKENKELFYEQRQSRNNSINELAVNIQKLRYQKG